MGSGARDDTVANLRAQQRAAQGINDPFIHTSQVHAGQAPAMNPRLDPMGVKVRESRDSDEHPESLAIAVAFDETGSMDTVPRAVQQALNKLFGVLVRKGYVAHPQVMMGAYGDARNLELAPLQVGQFESDNRVDDDLEAIFLEKNGGGNGGETAGLFLYFLARHTDIDCFNVRGQKGFAFLIGDEVAHPYVTLAEVKTYLGEDIGEPISVAQLVKEVQERYNLYFLIINNATAQGQHSEEYWYGLLGENANILNDPEEVAAVIAITIGLVLGTANRADIRQDMIDAGFDPRIAESAEITVAIVPQGTAVANSTGGALPGLVPTDPQGSVGAHRL